MEETKIEPGKLFLKTALVMMLSAALFGLLAALTYIYPDFLKESVGFTALRPLHVSSALFWIILGATGCVFSGLNTLTKKSKNNKVALLQWGLWILSISGIFISYFRKDFGGREYWEFNPIWALPIALAWILFLYNFFSRIKKLRKWPVYVWMWLTGIVFFMFIFLENYLWIFPYFRQHFITDMTIQWKVNGSLVGSWNQMLYGTAIFLMDKISGSKKAGQNKIAFAMYFLGLFNLMFNWGHHIYTLPTEKYIRLIGYSVSMTEWIIFLKIIYDWRATVTTIQKHYHYFPYKFIMASDIWVFFHVLQATLISIPAINIYTHGTHFTVAHSMGTTIGINTMILLAVCFEFLKPDTYQGTKSYQFLNWVFWFLQVFLLVFLIALMTAGIKKGLWQLSSNQSSFSDMMQTLYPYFVAFTVTGAGILITLAIFAFHLLQPNSKSKP